MTKRIPSIVAEEKMKRASFLAVLLVFMTTFAAFIALPDRAEAGTRYVGGSGFGNYTKIQEAIDDATPGATVYVYGGTYSGPIKIDKTISLVGEDANSTRIDGSGSDEESAVRIRGDWVNITGFTVSKGDEWWDDVAILVDASNCSALDNIVMNSAFGIEAHGDHNTIAHNTVTTVNYSMSMYIGIYVVDYSKRNSVLNNNIFAVGGGIALSYSRMNTIANNTVKNSRGGISVGHSHDNTIRDNNISSNNGSGISLSSSQYNVVVRNAVQYNIDGIYLDSAMNNAIVNNDLSFNTRDGVHAPYFNADHNLIMNNNIISNGGHGIYLKSSDSNLLSGNIIEWNKEDGIHIMWSKDNTITNNTVRFNKGRGIYVDVPDENLVSDNDVVLNLGDWSAPVEKGWPLLALGIAIFLTVVLALERRKRKKKSPW